jgi:hypothetical protein
LQPSWTGYFINLDRAADRRASIEGELRKAKIRPAYQRFRAIDGGKLPPGKSRLTPGEVGCFRSHAEVLRLGKNDRWLHVLEDDAMVSEFFGDIVERLLVAGTFQPYDLIFTDIIIAAPHLLTLHNLKAAYDKAMAKAPDIALGVMDLRNSNFGGANSYFVNPASIDKVRTLVEADLASGPTLGVDMLYRREVQQGRLRAACVFPFISRVHLALATQSTIGTGVLSPAQSMASDLLRLIFYIEADPAEVARELAPLKAPKAADKHLDFLADIVRVMIAD